MCKLVGWERRYDSAEALAALNALSTDLRLFQNLFQPSMKLVRKVRHGSRLRRHYDRPQPPWARLVACPEADPPRVAALQRLLARTDPFALSAQIDAQLEQVWAFANRVTRQPRATAPKIPQPRGVTPWHGWTFSAKVTRDRQEQRRHVAVGREEVVLTQRLTLG